jgi:phospholipid N-methyltransferase
MDQSGGIIHDEISAKKVPEEKLEIIEILKKFSAATDKKKAERRDVQSCRVREETLLDDIGV